MPDSSAAHHPSAPRIAITILVLGLFFRLAISAVSIGSNDTPTWMRFGLLVNTHGLAEAYHHDPQLNHPPIPTLWAAGCYALTWWQEQPFGFLMRLPAIAGDVLAGWLIWRILLRSHGARVACLGVCVFAISPAAVLISAYHCNTDSLCVALTLLALYLADRGRPGWAGFALGAAINIKLVPVFILPVLFLRADWRDRGRLFASLCLWTIPFLILFASSGPTAAKNIVGYGSAFESWGMIVVFRFMLEQGIWSGGMDAANFYHDYLGKWLMLIVICLVAVTGRRRVDTITAGAEANAWFLALTPGFGIQYLVYATTPILAAAPRWGLYLAAASGLFAFGVYFIYLEQFFPFFSEFISSFRWPTWPIGFVTWVIIVGFAMRGIWVRVRPTPTPTPPPMNQ